MNIVTHRFRGFSNRENSLDGFRNALEAGVKFYEFDLRLTKDGVPVLNHDRFLVNSTGEQYDIVTSFFHEVMKFSERSFEKATVNKVHNHAESETEKLTSAPKKNEPES
jgi:Glycerophosphoryl diester phosphodiesterase